jgi:N-glycosylase/DNA lyase
MSAGLSEKLTHFAASKYNLGLTLDSGQAFRWNRQGAGWEGIIFDRWVRLEQAPTGIQAETFSPVSDWKWLKDYLQIETDFEAVLKTFPCDEPMMKALGACGGLRLLRQEPWETLASFICSSTKQIVQIRQMVRELSLRFGNRVAAPNHSIDSYSFPKVERIAAATEQSLRECKLGFRAGYLQKTAQQIIDQDLDLASLKNMPVEKAREILMNFHGVGRKIADCVLLFGYGFQEAFPVDVWITKALKELYFPKGRPSQKRLLKFSKTHFGPNSGYAQQYLFHYMRVTRKLELKKEI